MKKLFLVALLAVSSAAMAQQDERRGFYLGAAAGPGRSNNACDNSSKNPNLDGCKASSIGWTGFGGYQFNRNVAFEAGYNHLGTVKYANGEIKSNAWEASLLGGFPTSENFTIFGRLGWYTVKNDSTVVGVDSQSYSAPFAGLTGQYELGRKWATRGDLVWYGASGAPGPSASDWWVARLGALWRFR